MQVKNEETINKILDFINTKLEEGVQPSILEIADSVKVSVATVSRYIKELIIRGELEKAGRYYNLSTNRSKKMDGVKNLPLIGSIACGTPIFAEENIESYIGMSSAYLGGGSYFALRAKGDSMINAGIDDGDIVILRQQNTADEGQIVVALVDGSDATLKRYYVDRKNKLIRLHPENDKMDDMFYPSIDIQGVAVKVIKELK